MILVDTSVWIDHLHDFDADLDAALEHDDVVTHPLVIGELAVGRLQDRAATLGAIGELAWLEPATHAEALSLIETRQLHGRGLSFTDVHLLASTLLVPGTRLLTRDRRLKAIAAELGVAHA